MCSRADSGIPCGHIEKSALGNSKKTCFMVRLTLWFVLRDFFRNFFLAVLNVYACRDQARKKIATVTDTLGT